jgi:hypothetical protein
MSDVRSRATSAIRSVPVRCERAGHADRAAEPAHGIRNAHVVGRDNDRVDAPRLRGAAVDVLDHRTTTEVRKDLSGKSCRFVPGGDDGDDSCGL